MSQYAKQETGGQSSTLAINNENPSSNSTIAQVDFNALNAKVIISSIVDLENLKKEVQELQNKVRKTESFYDSATKVNKTVHIVLIVFLLIPVLQLLFCTGIVYLLGIQDNLPGLLKWGLGSISVLSFIQIAIGGIKVFYHGERIDKLEKRIDSLSNKNII